LRASFAGCYDILLARVDPPGAIPTRGNDFRFSFLMIRAAIAVLSGSPTIAIAWRMCRLLYSVACRTLLFPWRVFAGIREHIRNCRELMQLPREQDELLRELTVLQEELRIKEKWLYRTESDSPDREQ
jgi:hypothetical protein